MPAAPLNSAAAAERRAAERRATMVQLDGLLSGFSPGTFASALVGAAALRVYDRRPRGFLNPSVRLLVAKSQVPGGGLGVFTEEALPAGTTLGAYPGRLLYSAEYSRKLAEHPRASSYCWKRQDGTVLDPTDRQGNIVEVVPLLEVGGGLGLGEAWGVPTTLARINEPPPRFDVNVDKPYP